MRDTVDADGGGDLMDVQIRGFQQCTGMREADAVQITDGRLPEILRKLPAEAVAADSGPGSQFCDRVFF